MALAGVAGGASVRRLALESINDWQC